MTEERDAGRQDTRTPSHEEVARRAYELFQSRGGESGHDIEHWLEAERELSRASGSEIHETFEGPPRDRDP
jgi:hypothetical protein